MFREIFNFNKSEGEKYSEEIVADIVDKLRTGEWRKVLVNESMGGNAGDNQSAINSYVEKETGRIIVFGNIQDLPEEITSNPQNTEVTFIYNFGNSFQRLRNNELESEPAFFKEVIMPGVSRQASANLKKALEIFNEEYKKEASSGIN